MSLTGLSQLSAADKTFFNTRLLRKAEPRLIHALFADQDGIPKNNGTTIEFRQFNSLPTVTNTLVEGVTPEPDQLEMTRIEAASEQMGTFVVLTDRVQYSAVDPVLQQTNELQGNQAGRSLDAKIRETMQQGTAVMRPNDRLTRDAVQSGDKLTFDMIDRMSVALENNEAETFAEHGNRYVCLLHPKTAYDLRQSELWKDLVKYNAIDPANRLADNYLGDTHNVRFFKSTATKIYAGEGSGGIDVYSTLMVARGFYGVAPLSGLEWILTPASDPLRQRDSAGWKVDFASLIKQDGYGVRAEHAVTL